MTAQEQTLAILFADVCDSTPLYESTGNFQALGLISRCIDGIAEIARAKRGQVIRSKGDDLLCTFESAEPALLAASSMLEAQARETLAIHVGLHYGAVIGARGDIFGAAVNLAARMLSLAKAGEILATDTFVEHLPATQRESMSLLGERVLKGKHRPISIYSSVLDEGDSTAFTGGCGEPAGAGCRARFATVKLALAYAGRELLGEEGHPNLLIGRSQRCDLVVHDPCVSREHATVSVANRQAVLTDHSSTGTFVCGADDRVIPLQRGSMQLEGSGTISLGKRTQGRTDKVIAFRKLVDA